MDEIIEIVRREAANVFAQLHMKSTLVATSYDPKKHAVKGMLMPHNVESDWIPIGALHIGNGFGVLVGANCGSKEKLDGDQFDVEFERGDPHNPIAKHRVFSVADQPPEVQSGEMLLMHQSGNKLFFDQGKNLTVQHHAGAKLVLHDDKSITIEHASGTSIAWDADGNITHDVKDKTISIAASQGGTIQLGQGAKSVSVQAPTDLAAGSTLGGLGIQTT